MRAALINTQTFIVENVIVADPSIDPAPNGYLLISIDNVFCDIGWKYDPQTGAFSNTTILE